MTTSTTTSNITLDRIQAHRIYDLGNVLGWDLDLGDRDHQVTLTGTSADIPPLLELFAQVRAVIVKLGYQKEIDQ